jgi:hypothetical protein
MCILLQRSLTLTDINEAEHLCKEWRKCLELWTAEKEMMMQTFRYMFPYMHWDCANNYLVTDISLKIDSNIMFRVNNATKYGKVASVSKTGEIMLYEYTFSRQNRLMGCFKFESGTLASKTTQITSWDYLGHFQITKGYVNKYVCLQLVKK